MKEIIKLTAILILLPFYASGTIYYVDGSAGADSNAGTSVTSAFATIRTCIDALASPGDECHIRKGRYHEAGFTISGKQGTSSQPIIIRGYQDEVPVIDGTIPLTPALHWIVDTNGIYSTRINQQHIWQLFVRKGTTLEMMTNARWPNALWSDKSVFLNVNWAKSAGTSTRDRMVDNGAKDLAGQSWSAKGAMAVLNIGSFNTFAAKVKTHTRGQNFFTYDDTFGAFKFKPSHNQYFLEDKLEFLDNAGEWFYNKTTRTVYVKTLDGATPKGRIQGKVQTYAFTISNCRHLHFKQLEFFGTTFKVPRPGRWEVIDRLSFDSINFRFPSYSKRMLGSPDPPEWTEIHPNLWNSFQLKNCTFYGTDGAALQYRGTRVRIENNLFEYNDWSVVLSRTKHGGLGTVISEGINDQFIRNTMRFNGASNGYRSNKADPVVRLNRIHDQCWGSIQRDGASIQFQRGAQSHGLVEKNWVNASSKAAIRFDAGSPPGIGRYGTIKKNVVWNTGAIVVKGDYETVLNNLAFDKRGSGCTLCVFARFRQTDKSGNVVYMNRYSVVRRNAADEANGVTIRGVTYTLPGTVSNNVVGSVRNDLMDPDNLDFRPLTSRLRVNNVGPYVYNPSSRSYWIPGRQLYKASIPVPPAGSTTVKVTRDAVMWLNAYGVSTHHVYFGTNEAAVAAATTTSPEHRERITVGGNVYYLSSSAISLMAGTSYYWRVDAEIDPTTLPFIKETCGHFEHSEAPAYTDETADEFVIGIKFMSPLSEEEPHFLKL